MVSREDVAERAGVSSMTVSRVISKKGYVSEKTRIKVEQAIKDLNYIPNKIAQNLVSQKSNVIAMIVQDITNLYYMQLLEEMIEIVNQQGYTVSLYCIADGDMNRILDDIISNHPIGIVNMALFSCEKKYYDLFRTSGVRTINFDVQTSCMLHIDYEPAMSAAMKLLKSTGHRHPVYLAGLKEDIGQSDDRIKLYEKMAGEFGYGSFGKHILFGQYPDQKALTEGYRLMNELLSKETERPDAVFCLNDMMAIGAIRAARDKGLNIPEDISVIGCDGVNLAEYLPIKITTMKLDIKSQAKKYTEYILGTTANNQLNLSPELKIGESVRLK